MLDAADDEFGLVPPTLDHGLDALKLPLVHQRAQLDRYVLRIAEVCRRGFHTLDVFVDELLRDALLHVQTAGGDADLAGAREDRVDGPRQCVVEVAVVKDDGGTLATELQRHALEVALRRRHLDLLARRDAPREADLADAHVARQESAGFAGSRDDLDHALGETGLLE